MDRKDKDDRSRDNFVEKLVKLNRTAKVVKGGRRFSFSALTVVGDRNGNVGYGFGKANDVTEAIRKSVEKAKRSMVKLPIKNGTIPHNTVGVYKASKVIMRPAFPGSGIIAGGAVRAIMEAGGITDIQAKSIGSRTSVNVIRATFHGLGHVLNANAVAKNRGKALKDMWS